MKDLLLLFCFQRAILAMLIQSLAFWRWCLDFWREMIFLGWGLCGGTLGQIFFRSSSRDTKNGGLRFGRWNLYVFWQIQTRSWSLLVWWLFLSFWELLIFFGCRLECRVNLLGWALLIGQKKEEMSIFSQDYVEKSIL